MHLSDLKHLPVTELVEMAIANEVEGASRMRKQDLIFALLMNKAKKVDIIFGDGTLELLQYGFGFLRRRFAVSICIPATPLPAKSAHRRKANVTSRWSRWTPSTANRLRTPSTKSSSKT